MGTPDGNGKTTKNTSRGCLLIHALMMLCADWCFLFVIFFGAMFANTGSELNAITLKLGLYPALVTTLFVWAAAAHTVKRYRLASFISVFAIGGFLFVILLFHFQ